jgi:hypothetical protein
MAMRTRRPEAWCRGLLAAMAAGAMAVVAACGTVVAGSGGHPRPVAGDPTASVAVPMCADAAHLDRMVVASLSPGLVMGQPPQALPVGVVVSDPARVRAVAAALCALPPLPPTHMRCPVILGEAYRLTFFAAGRAFPPVLAVAAPCRRSVSGLGPARLASVSFWLELRKELGVRGGTGVHTPLPAAP